MDKNLAKTDAEALMQVGACQISIPVDSNPFPVPQLPRDLFFLFIVADILSIFDCVTREAKTAFNLFVFQHRPVFLERTKANLRRSLLNAASLIFESCSRNTRG